MGAFRDQREALSHRIESLERELAARPDKRALLEDIDAVLTLLEAARPTAGERALPAIREAERRLSALRTRLTDGRARTRHGGLLWLLLALAIVGALGGVAALLAGTWAATRDDTRCPYDARIETLTGGGYRCLLGPFSLPRVDPAYDGPAPIQVHCDDAGAGTIGFSFPYADDAPATESYSCPSGMTWTRGVAGRAHCSVRPGPVEPGFRVVAECAHVTAGAIGYRVLREGSSAAR